MTGPKNYKFWIAHVDDPRAERLDFHLNIPYDRVYPDIGDEVFASKNNGRTGEIRTITGMGRVVDFPDCTILGRPAPFTSVNYVADLKAL